MAKAVTSLRDRLFSRLVVNPGTGCLEWTGYRDKNGYGRICRGGHQGQIIFTHRAMWELFNGSIPDDLVPDHLCENQACANLSHIELVTPGDNIRRYWARRKAAA